MHDLQFHFASSCADLEWKPEHRVLLAHMRCEIFDRGDAHALVEGFTQLAALLPEGAMFDVIFDSQSVKRVTREGRIEGKKVLAHPHFNRGAFFGLRLGAKAALTFVMFATGKQDKIQVLGSFEECSLWLEEARARDEQKEQR